MRKPGQLQQTELYASLIKMVNQSVLICSHDHVGTHFNMRAVALWVWSIMELRYTHPRKSVWQEEPLVAEAIASSWFELQQESKLKTPLDFLLAHGLERRKSLPAHTWYFEGKRLMSEFHGNKWTDAMSPTGFSFLSWH